MVKKAKLAKFIAGQRRQPAEWFKFMPQVTGLRVKEVGSQGEVQISLDDKGWFTPESWLANYRAHIRERLSEDLETAAAVLPPDVIAEMCSKMVPPQKAIAQLEQDDMDIVFAICCDVTKTPTQRLQHAYRHVLTKVLDDQFMYNKSIEYIQSTPKR